MPAQNPAERALIASIAANQSWAKTADRAARTAAARKAMFDRFEELVDPGITEPTARAAAAENLRRAHFQQMALKSARSRRATAAKKSKSRGDDGGPVAA